MNKGTNIFYRVFRFYVDGFRNLPKWGKQVWLVIFIKLFIMFFILKIFFFPNILKRDFDTDSERGEYVLDQITK